MRTKAHHRKHRPPQYRVDKHTHRRYMWHVRLQMAALPDPLNRCIERVVGTHYDRKGWVLAGSTSLRGRALLRCDLDGRKCKGLGHRADLRCGGDYERDG